MAKIPLTQGLIALVDDADYDMLMRYKWHALAGNDTYYAVRNDAINRGSVVMMHREIVQPSDANDVDHVNRIGLDNRRQNLRECSRSVNAQNCKLPITNTSGYRGVAKLSDKYAKRWRAGIKVGTVRLSGPRRATAEEAAKDYDRLARTHYGTHAAVNFPNIKENDENGG